MILDTNLKASNWSIENYLCKSEILLLPGQEDFQKTINKAPEKWLLEVVIPKAIKEGREVACRIREDGLLEWELVNVSEMNKYLGSGEMDEVFEACEEATVTNLEEDKRCLLIL